MAVDNANVVGMDYATLPANVAIVEWREAGFGEIEYNDRPRLRENFGDLTPYAPFFQQFMTRLSGITLAQAKKVQNDLLQGLFDYKRQAPISYTVGSVEYQFDASDSSVTAMCATALGGAPGSSNSLISQINSGIVNPGNALVGHDNSNSNRTSNAFLTISADITNTAALRDHINSEVINEMNANLQHLLTGVGEVAAPGLPGPSDVATMGFNTIASGDFPQQSSITFVAVGSAAGSIPWTPAGETDPIDMTTAELSGLMAEIAARRQELLTVQLAKADEVNAMTTVEDVIAYDVTTGWPP